MIADVQLLNQFGNACVRVVCQLAVADFRIVAEPRVAAALAALQLAHREQQLLDIKHRDTPGTASDTRSISQPLPMAI